MKTLQDARETVKALVDEYGDSTVRDCEYLKDDQPYCIAAHVLVAWGVTPKQLSDFDSELVYEYNRRSSLRELMTSEAMRYLDKAQEVQDNRKGSVVGFVDERVYKGMYSDATPKRLHEMTPEEKEKVSWGAAYRAAEASIGD